MIILYILAVIGALCLLSTAAMIVCVIISEKKVLNKKSIKRTAADICVLTGENCIFTVDKGSCNDCPIAEEAKNGTSSFNRP